MLRASPIDLVRFTGHLGASAEIAARRVDLDPLSMEIGPPNIVASIGSQTEPGIPARVGPCGRSAAGRRLQSAVGRLADLIIEIDCGEHDALGPPGQQGLEM